MFNNLLKKAGAITMAMAMAGCMLPTAAFAAGDAAQNTPGETDSSAAAGTHGARANATNDMGDRDTIDVNRKGSLHIYKYDITSAKAAGDWTQGDIKATGQQDDAVANKLKDYAIKGVEFSYLKVGNIETYTETDADTPADSQTVVVYEIPDTLATILELDTQNAFDKTDHPKGFYDMSKSTVANKCTKAGVHHYTSTQINDALSGDNGILKTDNVKAKNALEDYMAESTDKTAMPLTSATGETSASNLPLGLYLIVETKVPEEVTTTVNPWFVTLPFTNTSKQTAAAVDDNGASTTSSVSTDHTDNGNRSTDNNGGDYWLYDFYGYPKNQTGNPTLDKSVRNAYTTEAVTKDSSKDGTTGDSVSHGKMNDSTVYNASANYNGTNASTSLLVFNPTDGEHTADSDAANYVANRGGYTKGDNKTAGASGAAYSDDFAYRDTTTASQGDLLDYILVAKIPTITSSATALKQFTFTDTLSAGLKYNEDVRIAIYDNAEDAKVNNTKNAVQIWDKSEGNDSQSYNGLNGSAQNNYYFLNDYVSVSSSANSATEPTTLTIQMTKKGLELINGEEVDANLPVGTGVAKGLSDYYMVAYYTATVNSDKTVVLGDKGNPNDVALTWSRTSEGFYNSLQDRNYVYAYGIDLQKQFSKNDGNFADVEFKLYNETDAYYVIAQEDAQQKGLYYVTGKTKSKSDATTLTPATADGKLYIYGLEGDKYELTEVKTSDGYTLLKDQIVIDITETDRDIKASVAGTVGMDEAAAAKIIDNYGNGIKNEDGQLVDEAKTEDLPESANNKDIARQVASDEKIGSETENNSGGGTTPNGRTIGKTDMYVGDIVPASCTVDGKAAKISTDKLTGKSGDATSDHAIVPMSVLNEKNWTLPQTGGAGLYLITILGILALAGGVAMNRKKDVA